ncbi:thiosulfate dehydrogenase [quinone] large subunit [Saccharicrinis carchari]|uniref:Thiosulfate dehydrogenase [quinone] large subunit n=1 Tax=Saccharicrinis carchari TaxID=1168039 RepID=A0A521DFK6_SACCC|nr:TQO small subunit DoxD [Saccharicrinis carchari]SMO70493.1 thiosulfate dehydrogenase [quinone] large subunit [Saccharicrinis carchari]
MKIKNDSGLLALAVRLVIGWTYFSAFFRRTILANKLDPEVGGYIGEKFNHFLPNALGIKPIIQYLVENPDTLWWAMVIFTIVEGIVGLFIMLGFFTRLMSVGIFGLAMGILLGSGWIGTTCLDEWQIGVLGIASGFMLFLSGSGMYSIDNYLMQKKHWISQKKWFPWIGSGTLPIKDRIFPKIVLAGSLFILAMTLFTNQVFHGGLWGTLHNKSVKPKLEISEGQFMGNQISFDVFRTEGVDVYGAWIIGMELNDGQNNNVFNLSQDELASLKWMQVENYYVAKVKPGKHSLVVPLGAKAKISIQHPSVTKLPKGKYRLKITDISGASWVHQIVR